MKYYATNIVETGVTAPKPRGPERRAGERRALLDIQETDLDPMEIIFKDQLSTIEYDRGYHNGKADGLITGILFCGFTFIVAYLAYWYVV